MLNISQFLLNFSNQFLTQDQILLNLKLLFFKFLLSQFQLLIMASTCARTRLPFGVNYSLKFDLSFTLLQIFVFFRQNNFLPLFNVFFLIFSLSFYYLLLIFSFRTNSFYVNLLFFVRTLAVVEVDVYFSLWAKGLWKTLISSDSLLQRTCGYPLLSNRVI